VFRVQGEEGGERGERGESGDPCYVTMSGKSDLDCAEIIGEGEGPPGKVRLKTYRLSAKNQNVFHQLIGKEPTNADVNIAISYTLKEALKNVENKAGFLNYLIKERESKKEAKKKSQEKYKRIYSWRKRRRMDIQEMSEQQQDDIQQGGPPPPPPSQGEVKP